MNSCWRKLRGRVVDSLTRALLPFWPLRASRLKQSSRRRVSTIAGHAPRAHRQPLQRLLQLQQLLLGRTILLILQQCKPSCGGLAKPQWIGKSSRHKRRYRHRRKRRRRRSSKSSRASTPQGLAQDLETTLGIL